MAILSENNETKLKEVMACYEFILKKEFKKNEKEVK
jgi:hypothetical protein